MPISRCRICGAKGRAVVTIQVAVQGTRAVDRYGPLGCRRALACARSAEKERCRGWGAGPRFRDGCTRGRPRIRDLTRHWPVAPPPRNRWFVDSPLEGDGFELTVPPRRNSLGPAIWFPRTAPPALRITIRRGTKSSNPAPSRGESAANLLVGSGKIGPAGGTSFDLPRPPARNHCRAAWASRGRAADSPLEGAGFELFVPLGISSSASA